MSTLQKVFLDKIFICYTKKVSVFWLFYNRSLTVNLSVYGNIVHLKGVFALKCVRFIEIPLFCVLWFDIASYDSYYAISSHIVSYGLILPLMNSYCAIYMDFFAALKFHKRTYKAVLMDLARCSLKKLMCLNIIKDISNRKEAQLPVLNWDYDISSSLWAN